MYPQEKLLKMLSSNKPSVRYDACEWIRVGRESSPEIVIALEKATRDADKEVANRATLALRADVHHRMAIKMGMHEPDYAGENEINQLEDISDKNIIRKPSGLGIASSDFSTLALLAWMFPFVFPEKTGSVDIMHGMSIYGYYICFGNPIISLVALLLGIAGLSQKDSAKEFAIYGIVISALSIFRYFIIFLQII